MLFVALDMLLGLSSAEEKEGVYTFSLYSEIKGCATGRVDVISPHIASSFSLQMLLAKYESPYA
jgi:hypothetical protein